MAITLEEMVNLGMPPGGIRALKGINGAEWHR